VVIARAGAAGLAGADVAAELRRLFAAERSA
jgi:hypothetical protein